MEKATNEETIDSKYIILDKKGSGLTANVFKVRDKENQTLYAAKVLKKPSNYFAKEIEVLKIIKPEPKRTIFCKILSKFGAEI